MNTHFRRKLSGLKNCAPHFFLSALIVLSLFSCGSIKHHEMVMLEEVSDDLGDISNIPTLFIQVDDILNIQVASRNPENVVAFRQLGIEANAASGERAFGGKDGYRVDEKGNIYLPFIGSVQAVGKTLVDLREEITKKLSEYIPDASVQIRFSNFRVTLLGEVNRPNTYIIPNERLTILEAIGMAGDFTSYARRNAVLIIRERSSEVREFARIDTQQKTLFESPYFYLRPNDIVYVEPLKAKQYATSGDFFQRYSSLILPAVSLSTFIIGMVVTR